MMMLRSSSTPILGSLLSSSSSSSSSHHFLDSPSNHPLDKSHNHPSPDPHKNLSFSHGTTTHHHPNSSTTFHSFSCHFPDSLNRDLLSCRGGGAGFRRARSDSNLEALMSDLPDNPPPPTRSSSRRPTSVLQTIPSFSMYSHREEEDQGEDEEEEEEEIGLERSVTIGENIGGEFCFSGMKYDAGSVDNASGIGAPPLFLARGLGIDVGDPGCGLIGGTGGGGRGGGYPVLTDYGGDPSDTEMYYRRMVEGDPCNALFLRNYAQFLHQTKGDIKGAEEYYSRAILAEPGDGDILSQYAKLVWELHRDHERASSYFERAVQAAPQDSHVLAAYACFMWETEDEHVEGREYSQLQDYGGAPISYGALASSTT